MSIENNQTIIRRAENTLNTLDVDKQINYCEEVLNLKIY